MTKSIKNYKLRGIRRELFCLKRLTPPLFPFLQKNAEQVIQLSFVSSSECENQPKPCG